MNDPRVNQEIAFLNERLDIILPGMIVGIARHGYEQAVADFTKIFSERYAHVEVPAIAAMLLARAAQSELNTQISP